jgi:alcohol dehydrogenase
VALLDFMSQDRPTRSEARSEAARSRYLNIGPRHHWEADVGGVRVFFGDGRISEVGRIAITLGAERALIVTDRGVSAAGHTESALTSLSSNSIETEVFDGSTANPTSDLIEAAAQTFSGFRPDLIVGLGGGSPMDCAKGINFLLTNGGSITDYWGYGRPRRPMLPSIGVPTTAGTGSEAQSFALISDSKTGRKMACGASGARFHSVILDPALIESAPSRVASAAGIDAISHAVESLVSTRSNPISRMSSMRAWELLVPELMTVKSPDKPAINLGNVLLGAHLAGAAIEQSMLGATHACANPLTATYGVAHGEAIAVLLPRVVRFNSPVAGNRYKLLNQAANLDSETDPGEGLAAYLTELCRILGLPDSLRALGISKNDLGSLADAAALEWTARFNPRPVSQAELLEIYEAAY